MGRKRRKIKYKIKIAAILASAIAGGALMWPAFADTPKQLTKILTSPIIFSSKLISRWIGSR